MAAYTGQYPPSGGSSQNAQFLELGGDGKWTESSLSIRPQGGILSFCLAAQGKEPALVICKSGGVGGLFGRRQTERWTFGDFPAARGWQASLAIGDSGLAMISVGEQFLLMLQQQDRWEKQSTDLPAGKITAAHVAAIAGKLKVACFDQTSSKLYLLTRQDGAWSSVVGPTTAPLGEVGLLRLFEWEGQPAVLALGSVRGNRALLLLRPADAGNSNAGN
jgi:hypothetical protein